MLAWEVKETGFQQVLLQQLQEAHKTYEYRLLVEPMQRVMCYHYRSQAKQREMSCTMTVCYVAWNASKNCDVHQKGLAREQDKKATVKIFLTDSKINEKTPGHHRALSWGSTHGKYYLNLQMNNADYKLGHPCLTCCYMSWRWHSFMQRDEINIKQTPRPVYCCCARLDNVENMATKKNASPLAHRLSIKLHSCIIKIRHQSMDHERIMPSSKAPCVYIFF